MPDNLKDALKKLAERCSGRWKVTESGLLMRSETGNGNYWYRFGGIGNISSDEADIIAESLGLVIETCYLGETWYARVYEAGSLVCVADLDAVAIKLDATRAGLVRAISLYLEKEKP